MLQAENDSEPGASAAQTAAEHPDSVPTASRRIDAQFSTLTAQSVPANPNSSASHEHLVSRHDDEFRGMFTIRAWHKPYAAALLETDPTKFAASISSAKQAILSRYLELSVSKVPTEETLDLQHAEAALSQLK